MTHRVERLSRGWVAASFVPSAGIILGLTGLAKVFSAIGAAQALDIADPLLAVPFRQLFLLVGLAELLIAFFCLFTEKRRISLVAVAWVSTNFLVYRLGLLFIGWHRPCGCMGSLTGMLHISLSAADNIMKVILAYLLVGSYARLPWEWRRGRVAKSAIMGAAVGVAYLAFHIGKAEKLKSWRARRRRA